MNIETVEVGGIKYNVAQASAVDQKKLLHMMAARLTYAVGKDTEVALDVNFIFGGLMAMSEADFDTVAKLVLYKAAVNGESQLVDIANFQGKITDFYMLVAEATICNLRDFLDWLHEARKPSVEPVTVKGEEQTIA